MISLCVRTISGEECRGSVSARISIAAAHWAIARDHGHLSRIDLQQCRWSLNGVPMHRMCTVGAAAADDSLTLDLAVVQLVGVPAGTRMIRVQGPVDCFWWAILRTVAHSVQATEVVWPATAHGLRTQVVAHMRQRPGSFVEAWDQRCPIEGRRLPWTEYVSVIERGAPAGAPEASAFAELFRVTLVVTSDDPTVPAYRFGTGGAVLVL